MRNSTLQILLNGQPIHTHEYIGENGDLCRGNEFKGFREIRHEHTDGEVTCISTEQYVSLPAMAVIGKPIKNFDFTFSNVFLFQFPQRIVKLLPIFESVDCIRSSRDVAKSYI